MNFKLYQKTCTRNKIQEIKEASDTNKLQRIYLIGGDEGDLPEGGLFQRDISLKITNLGFQSRFLVEYRPGITSVRDEA